MPVKGWPGGWLTSISDTQYLVLGDTTVVVETTDGIEVFNDDRVDTTAQAERAEANRYPFGSAQ